MIEIKSWRDGRVLFTAKNATDVRQAVEEARKAGADLWDADLWAANLGAANLGGANLRGANLRGANLWDANLGGANLGGADLGDADRGAANLRGANLGGADLGAANLGGANLGAANLWAANLGGADLGAANLGAANLGGANLGAANLWGADLRGANLWDAKGLAPERVNDLLLLLDQVGPIRAYKLVDSAYQSPIQSSGKITYRMGETVEAKADTNPDTQCGKGINLATLPWCLKNWQPGYRVLVVEFTAKDVAAVPVGDGKFRVSRAKVIREIPQEQVHGWLGLNPDGSVVADER